MNIFYVDKCPRAAAVALHDKHVVKMVLETAQILSTVVQEAGLAHAELYKPTHKNHPAVLWAGQSIHNFRWLVRHGLALSDEYTHRFGKTHKSRTVIITASHLIRGGKSTRASLPAQCMPPQYKVDYDSVSAYRNYYRAEKVKQSRWTNRQPPEWINESH